MASRRLEPHAGRLGPQRPPKREVLESERLGGLVRRFPNVRGTVLAQTADELSRFETHGVPALLCNAFVDERVIRFLDGVERSHDAVYDARLDRFKRHELARDVQRLALITYLNADTDRAFASRVAARFASATWFNGPPGPDVRMLSAQEVNRAYNACRVGLCLSAREGRCGRASGTCSPVSRS